jgi:predicted nucleotidyltransferase
MFDVEKALQALEKRDAARSREHRALWEKADAEARFLVHHVAQKYRPKRLWQWGSVLQPENFGPHSDIDLAIEGVRDAPTFFAILGDAMELCSFSCDIVDLDKIVPEFASIIRTKGKIVYENPGNDSSFDI